MFGAWKVNHFRKIQPIEFLNLVSKGSFYLHLANPNKNPIFSLSN